MAVDGGWFDGDDEIRIRVTTLADGYHYQTPSGTVCDLANLESMNPYKNK